MKLFHRAGPTDLVTSLDIYPLRTMISLVSRLTLHSHGICHLRTTRVSSIERNEINYVRGRYSGRTWIRFIGPLSTSRAYQQNGQNDHKRIWACFHWFKDSMALIVFFGLGGCRFANETAADRNAFFRFLDLSLAGNFLVPNSYNTAAVPSDILFSRHCAQIAEAPIKDARLFLHLECPQTVQPCLECRISARSLAGKLCQMRPYSVATTENITIDTNINRSFPVQSDIWSGIGQNSFSYHARDVTSVQYCLHTKCRLQISRFNPATAGCEPSRRSGFLF
jgi:hypothetical protein